MAPSAVEETISQRDAWKSLPPPTLHPVKEARFEKYLPPQLDGREKALAQPDGQAAIVIDNGKHPRVLQDQWSKIADMLGLL
jgi:actin-related protein 5